ncbi:HNH endonuclease signature motif containing protein [Psychroserpens sp. NJDZ02]|uniref:HNH endonuclease signature motif containing protein n=1 Tax=Psychroserpens sp. NJDZ02 TaxID=2570561 RepID=UPI0010A8F19E|nr:HNH endonuclease signature motif containing protein [Psychroserpens sp. NJDZ02]QCE43379.1 HNH endonuclease [Psychroserpens sp. NJDZ02]
MERIVSNFMKYGISQNLAEKLFKNNLTITTVKNTSQKNLIEKYSITKIEAKNIKSAISRKPIEKEIANSLLLNNNYTCCCCLGQKGKTFIIHHITEYENTQDNSYENLAVLCPVCHDLAHGKRSLTLSINKEQILESKRTWEAKCKVDRLDYRTEPLHEFWEAEFSNSNEKFTLNYSIDVSLREEDGITKGWFNIEYLNRGNLCLQGEFEHPTTDADVDVELYFWGLRWNMRATKKEKVTIVMNYMFGDEIHWFSESEIAGIIPYELILKMAE